MLAVKLSAAKIGWYWYLVIGIVAYAGASVGTYFVFKPTDKKLARKMDSEYGLRERLQTAIEFADEEGDILVLQREDADKALDKLPAKKFSIKTLVQYVVVAAVGVSFFLAGILVPSKYVPPYDGDFKYEGWDEEALLQLIEEVKGIGLDESVLAPVVESLEKLDEELKELKNKADMQTKVEDAAKAIDKVFVSANTYREIVVAMNSYTGLNEIKKTIVEAADAYKESGKAIIVNDMNATMAAAEQKMRETLEGYFDGYVDSFNKLETTSEMKDKVFVLLDPLNESMADESLMEKLKDDALYNALSDYSSVAGEVAEEYYNYGLTALRNEISRACDALVTTTIRAMLPQVKNRIADDYIHQELMVIFGVTLTQDELKTSDATEGGGDNSTSGGAIGDKETVVGGEDTVYDPKSETHVKFSEIWVTSDPNESYSGELSNLITDPDSGLSDEMKNYIEQYMKLLDGAASSEETGEEAGE